MQTNLLTRASGVTATSSSAVDVYLSTSDAPIQSINMTSANLSVYLPDATTLSIDVIYTFIATGYVYSIRDYTGRLLAQASVEKTITVYLINTSTSAGIWFAGTQPAYSAVQTPPFVAYTPSNNPVVAALSSTKAILICYSNSLTKPYAIPLDINGSVITVGVPVVLNNDTSTSSNPFIVRLSDTQAVCMFGTSQEVVAQVITLNGSAITCGPPTSIYIGSPTQYIRGVALTATKALFTLTVSGSGLCCVVLTTDGADAITAGAFQSGIYANASMSSYTPTAALSDSRAIIGFQTSIGNVTKTGAMIVDINDTTVTAYAPLLYPVTMNGGCYKIIVLSPTKIIISSSSTVWIFEINNTTVVVGKESKIVPMFYSSSSISISEVSLSEVLCTYTTNTYNSVYSTTLSIDGLNATHAAVSTNPLAAASSYASYLSSTVPGVAVCVFYSGNFVYAEMVYAV